ncbi:protein phosphatase 2C domain-containing protein [Bacillus sp. FJAT-49736]|uniref:protein phosphatase 2C domain-containing protein n=1 Tax=Bacillus sp. FJAT-49736 TaxID=2833582 RepID=UPI001BCA4398|nr:protein phosphatase 2C domain-containing protein [Bacillus sp. FJAT-49736]MBS4174500.1 protein phosphatase 2C domain-containing protein [Bacillus sp. FJAT-49736]
MELNYRTFKGVGDLNEDSYIINKEMSIFGVADGVSSLIPFKSRENLTGGYMASHEVKNYLQSITTYTSLFEDITNVNRNLQKKMREYEIDILEKEKLWGTALAIVRVSDFGIEFVQTGDCMILAVYQNDEVRPLTRLQVAHLEELAFSKWKEYINRGIKTREDLMKKVKDILISNRRKSNTPMGYGVLNGEPQAINFLEHGKINNIGLKHLILITDGMFLPAEHVPEEVSYWDYTAKCILDKGIEQYARDLIALEETDPECLKYIRFKKSDDKTGMVLTFNN